MKYRLLNKIYADLFGYFWTTCPLCGQMFGGHECKGGSIMTSWDDRKKVCPDCEKKVDEYNQYWMKNHPHPEVYVN